MRNYAILKLEVFSICDHLNKIFKKSSSLKRRYLFIKKLEKLTLKASYIPNLSLYINLFFHFQEKQSRVKSSIQIYRHWILNVKTTIKLERNHKTRLNIKYEKSYKFDEAKFNSNSNLNKNTAEKQQSNIKKSSYSFSENPYQNEPK